MSWNASMIIIENKHGFSDEAALLRVLGKGDYALYSDEEVLDDALAPFDGSIHIGYFNDTIIMVSLFGLVALILFMLLGKWMAGKGDRGGG